MKYAKLVRHRPKLTTQPPRLVRFENVVRFSSWYRVGVSCAFTAPVKAIKVKQRNSVNLIVQLSLSWESVELVWNLLNIGVSCWDIITARSAYL
jgi:hypothetical protein